MSILHKVRQGFVLWILLKMGLIILLSLWLVGCAASTSIAAAQPKDGIATAFTEHLESVCKPPPPPLPFLDTDSPHEQVVGVDCAVCLPICLLGEPASCTLCWIICTSTPV